MTKNPSETPATPNPDDDSEQESEEENVPAEYQDFAPVKDPVPDGTWKMVKTTLRNLDQSDELTGAEVQVATLVYLKDEASRNSRMGGVLTGVGGIGAAGGGAWTLFTTQFQLMTYVAAFGLAAIAVGQFVKLYGAHREGVGPMAAAIIEARQGSEDKSS